MFGLLFQYVSHLGMPASWNFTDVWGLDPEVLAFVQGPVKSVLLLYPISYKVRMLVKLEFVKLIVVKCLVLHVNFGNHT